MRILFASLNPPLLASGGGAMTGHTLVRFLLARGHDVGVLYLDPAGHGPADQPAVAKALRDMGVRFVESIPIPPPAALPRRALGRLMYSPRAMRRWAQPADHVASLVGTFRPDACFLYGMEAIEAFVKVRGVPKVGGIGVLPHHLVRVRLGLHPTLRPRHLLERLLLPVADRHHQRNARELLGTVDRVCFFAENYARHCRDAWGLGHAVYVPNPALDERPHRSPAGAAEPGRRRHRVVLVGHLLGTATQSGLKFFAEGILPELDRRGEAEAYEFLLVGRHLPPAWLQSMLRRPNVRLLGFVENFADAIHGADALLVPIPADVGNRVRIVSAFSAEACVVTHASSRLGMPELVHGENCLIGETAEEIAGHLRRACTDRELNQRLRQGARATYERWFEPSVACARVEECLQASAGRGREAAARPALRPSAAGPPAHLAPSD